MIGKRASKSRPGAGIVELHHRCCNQDEKLVAECRRQRLHHDAAEVTADAADVRRVIFLAFDSDPPLFMIGPGAG